MHLDDHSLSLWFIITWTEILMESNQVHSEHLALSLYHNSTYSTLHATYNTRENKKWKNRSQIKGLNSYKSNYFHTENNSKPIYILEKSEKNNHQGKTSFVFQKPAILFCGGRVFFLMIKDPNTLLTTLVGKLVT